MLRSASPEELSCSCVLTRPYLIMFCTLALMELMSFAWSSMIINIMRSWCQWGISMSMLILIWSRNIITSLVARSRWLRGGCKCWLEALKVFKVFLITYYLILYHRIMCWTVPLDQLSHDSSWMFLILHPELLAFIWRFTDHWRTAHCDVVKNGLCQRDAN